MRLIDDAKRAWRLFSVQAMSVAAAVQLTWATISDDLKQGIPHWIPTTLTVTLLFLGIGGRLVKQPPKEKSE